MTNNKFQKELSLLEAVDHLSDLADSHTPVDIEREACKDKVNEAFRVVHSYLKHVYEKEAAQLKDPDMRRGIQAMMVLAGEAAQKINRVAGKIKGKVSAEFGELQDFYLNKVMKRFKETLENEEGWQQQWQEIEEESLSFQTKGLKDLETVRRDRDYELFYIRKEDGQPFFNRNLLRHIKLVGDFDETVSDPSGDDPFVRIQLIQDQNLHDTAHEIIERSYPEICEFYREAMQNKDQEIVALLNQALIALMLAANPRHLISNTNGKNAINYFKDYLKFLRASMFSPEYDKWLNTPSAELDHFCNVVLHLIHDLCFSLFDRTLSRKEMVQFIHRLIEKGERSTGRKAAQRKGGVQWNDLLDEDELIRHVMTQYPNGPLLKTLDVFREGEERYGFDPLMQDNIPSILFGFSAEGVELQCLRIPSPTIQDHIDKAKVDKEFEAFLRSLKTKGKKKLHLLVNLQDRTSWKEHARCKALEEMHRRSDFTNHLIIVTMPKNTDFYFQSENYLNMNKAELFMKLFREQVASGEECGFYFPSHLKSEEISRFAGKIIELVHELFFEGKRELSRSDRLDFVEIFYQLFILKLVDWFYPSSISFTCKDAIDTGAAQAAAFFGFLRLLISDEPWTSTERDFLMWILYAPAILIRERAIDGQIFSRQMSMLAKSDGQLGNKRKEIIKALTAIYKLPLFTHPWLKIPNS